MQVPEIYIYIFCFEKSSGAIEDLVLIEIMERLIYHDGDLFI